MTSLPRPYPESYWVLPDQFLAGEHPSGLAEQQTRSRLLDLLKAGIHTFVDLTHPSELPSYQPILHEAALALGQGAAYRRFVIPDRGVPDRQEMLKILDFIDAEIAAGHHVYLHCWGGVGRTGTTVGCFLVRHGRSGQQALEHLAALWQDVPKRLVHPRSPETDEQVRFIMEWREALTAGPQASR